MPLFFSSPAAAWLLPAIALPIVFHLFFRLRRQVREFPSLMFFLRIDPRLSAKRKIHEWLILLLRCLFIALLIGALLRPILGTKSFGQHVARLVLIDNSGSMAGNAANGGSKLALATRAASLLLSSSRPGDSFGAQLMLPDPTATLPDKLDATLATIRDALGKVSPSDGAAPVGKAIRRALAALDSAKDPQRELHIITDLQKDNWSRGELEADVHNCRIIVHRIDSAPLHAGSVSLETVSAPAREIPISRVTPVRFILQNHSPAEAHVRVNSADDSGQSSLREMAVPANSSAPITLTFTFASPGFHWAQIWLEGDAAPAASRVDLVFFCSAVRQVIFAGTEDDFGAMPYAVAPGGNANLSGIDAVFATPDLLPGLLAQNPLAVAITWDGMAKLDGSALPDYVRRGGTLFLLPSPNAGVTVPPTAPEWIGGAPGALVKAQTPEPAVLLREGDALWQDLADASGRPNLGGLRIFQDMPLKLGADWQTCIASAKGAPLFSRRSLSEGSIFASGLAFTAKWSSLPLKAAFVVLMQNAVFGPQQDQLPVQSIRAGDDFRFDAQGTAVRIRSLAGAALDWRGPARDFPGFAHSGVYEITQGEHTTWAAVSGNVDEADPVCLPLAPVALLHGVPHEIVALTQAADITRTREARGSGAPLYRWLLLLGLVVLLAETWLANERSSDLGRKLFASLRATPPKSTKAKSKEMARV